MKKKAFTLAFSAMVVLSGFTLLPSCNKSAFPRDPYRGASMNPNTYPQKRAKAKDTRQYRNIKAKPTY